LHADSKRISFGRMPRKPRVTTRSLDPRRVEIAERVRHLACVAGGPDVPFEHQQDVAAAVVAAVLAELAKADQERTAGSSEREGAG